ncbi:MAG: D,D-dipeptide ABC transporter permease, partial [Chloroflexaceae bacterium]|nr:D,D-dipeptide ABC transporter permease [Chloroflexaceae bacterium]
MAQPAGGSQRGGNERFGDIWYALRRNPITLFGLFIVLTVIILGALAPIIAPYGPTEKNFAYTSVPPGTEGFLLGTDQFGHDILSRLLYGARLDMLIAISAVATSLVIGSFFGAIAAYVGGAVDEVTMRAMDVTAGLPALYLCNWAWLMPGA